MAVIVENRPVSDGIYLMTVEGIIGGHCGQFYMIKPNATLDPLLGRPISIFNVDEQHEQTSFLYHVVGKGTHLMHTLRPGMQVSALGPYGNGFPLIDDDITIIGGGIGIAPLFLLAKMHSIRFPDRIIQTFLGFSKEPYLVDAFAQFADSIHYNVGGYIVDDVPFLTSTYYACGPMPMLQAAASKVHAQGSTLYVSLENHMACGVGACLGCTCQTQNGNRRVCKDGPVFLSTEVFYDA